MHQSSPDHEYADLEGASEDEEGAGESRDVVRNCWSSITRPATHCCLWVPLVRGVRLISLYTLFTGFLYLPNVKGDTNEGLPKDVARYKNLLGYTWWLVNFMGIVMGLQGLLGLKTGDSRKLRHLFAYYLVKLAVEIPTIIWHEAYVCLLRDAAVKQHPNGKAVPSCDKVRASYRQMELADVIMFLVFAHAVWSMARRIETSDFDGLESYPLDYADSYLPLMNNPGLGNQSGLLDTPFDGRQGPLAPPTAPTQRPRVDRQSLQPFSGQAFRLE